MLPDRAVAARLAQTASVAAFVTAAAAMLIAGALQSSGRPSTSSMLATLGYALGIAGVATGVLALTLESPALDTLAHRGTQQETS